MPVADPFALRRRRRRGRLVQVFLVLAPLGIVYAVTLPPRALPPPSTSWRPVVPTPRARGVVHVHTQRSDGSGTFDEVARAAGAAGLDFVIFSDHGDGTRAPEPPAYRAGVLCIDAVEISTSGGHVLALGLPGTPFRLAGDPADVVEDIHRFGGLAFATHPDSVKPALAWKHWDVPIDGFEWLNGDSAWRDESRLGLVRMLLHYPLRGPESIATLFTRPDAALERWDRLSAQGRPLIAIAGADAHARFGWQDTGDDDADSWKASVEAPSYEAVFRSFSLIAELDAPLAGVADEDAARVLSAFAAGRIHTAIDGYARGGTIELFGRTETGIVRTGGRVAPGALKQVVARVQAHAGTTIRLLRNGVRVAESTGEALEWTPGPHAVLRDGERAAAFRVEVWRTRNGDVLPAPWLLSNPIRVSGEVAADDSGDAEPGSLPNDGGATDLPLDRVGDDGWRVERDARSRGTIARGGAGESALRMDFELGRGQGSRWVAAALPLTGAAREALGRAREIVARVRADSPMRVSLQVRAASDAQDLRWVRSVFVAGDARTVRVPLRALAPVGPAAARSSVHTADTLLVVVDRTNTTPGRAGSVWIEGLTLR